LRIGTYQLAQTIKHLVQEYTDKENSQEHSQERNKHLIKLLAALGIATTSGIIASADFSHIIAHIDVVRLVELGIDVLKK
jgi:hypothetical protein